MAKEEPFVFKVLIKREDDEWVAHCLELDLIAVSDDPDQVEKDIIDIIVAQVRDCIANDNLDHLYRAASVSVWKEYFASTGRREMRGATSSAADNEGLSSITPLIRANAGFSPDVYHA